jgi:large subunit ribosomal protein L9
VKRGFGRNYLIPQGLATYALDGKTTDLAADTAFVEANQDAADTDMSRRVALFLSRNTLEMKRQDGNEWAINASMLSHKCAQHLRLDMPVERIVLEQPLVTFGQHDVSVLVDDGTSGTLRVNVVRR